MKRQDFKGKEDRGWWTYIYIYIYIDIYIYRPMKKTTCGNGEKMETIKYKRPWKMVQHKKTLIQ